MHIEDEMIREELRARGKLFRRLMPYMTERRFRVINKVMVPMKHRNFSKALRMGELRIPREDGSSLRVVVFRPKREMSEPVPGVLWIHGGGYGIGLPEQDATFAEIMEDRHDCVVLMPDYTLATKAPYPAALLDCYRTLLYMKGCFHAFDIVCSGSDVARDARAFLGDAFENACRTCFA